MRKHWQKEAREKQKKITRRKKLLFSSQLTPIHITPEQQSLAEKSKHFDLIRTNKRQIKANITLQNRLAEDAISEYKVFGYTEPYTMKNE